MIETGAIDDAFLQELKNICGADHVAADQLSRDLNSLTTDPQIRACGAIVYPASSAEVQAILKLCARHGVEVWPYSRGNNWGYGTKSALKPGALIMMLERMNRIIEVHPELAYAVIEPGVTQQQLFDHLGEQHPHLMADCTDSTPLGSVLGNAIERGYGYTPYGDHYGQLCGLEVVLPTGEILSTGGTDSSCPTWNTHKWGSGPSIDGLFSQGNLGVVVKGGIWLHPKPAHQVLFTVDISADQVSAAVDALRELALRGTLRCHVHMANAFQTLTLLQKMPAEWQARGVSIPPHELQRRTGKFGISDWTAVGGLYGTTAQINAAQRDLRRTLRGVGTVTLIDEKKLRQSMRLMRLHTEAGGRGLVGRLAQFAKSLITRKDFALLGLLPDMFGILHGKPTWSVLRSAYFKSHLQPGSTQFDPARDGCGLMWLAPALPMTGGHAKTILALVAPLFVEFDFNMSACLTMMNQRTLFLLLGIFFDQENETERQRAAAMYRALQAMLKAHGYQKYRSGTPAWEGSGQVNAANSLLQKIKMVVDPAQILSPGRYQVGSVSPVQPPSA